MDKNKSNNMELDFKELMWRLLAQWKFIVIVSLLLALFMCAAKYYLDMQAYKEQVAFQQEAEQKASIPIDEQIEEILNNLTAEDREVIKYVLKEEEWLSAQRKYLDKSILMQTDPINQRVLSLVFNIDAEDNDDLPILLRSYYNYLYGTELAESVQPYIDKNADIEYIGELFYNEDYKTTEVEVEGESAALEVNMVLPENIESEIIAESIKEAFLEYSEELQSIGPHTISIVSSKDTHIYHKVNAERKTKIISDVYNMGNSLNNAENTLSETQLAAWNAIKEAKKNVSLLENNNEQKNNNIPIAVPGIRGKYALLGFVFGIALYSLIYLVAAILKGNIISPAQLSSISNVRTIGEIYYKKENKGLSRIFKSEFVDKLHLKGNDDISVQLNRTVEKLRVACRHANTDSIVILNLSKNENNPELDALVDAISTRVQTDGFSIDIEDIKDDFNEETLLTKKIAVLMVDDSTRETDYNKAMSICDAYEVEVLGNIFVAEY